MTAGWRGALVAVGFLALGLGASALLFELSLPYAVAWVGLCSTDAGGNLCSLAAFMANSWWLLLLPWLAVLLWVSVWGARRVVGHSRCT